jgi:hypothetical protein
MARDECVGAFEQLVRCRVERAGCACPAGRAQQVSSADASSRERSVDGGDVPGRRAFLLRHRLEERRSLGVLLREERESSVTVESGDATRREAAEASAAVVEENRTSERCRHAVNEYSAATPGSR